MGGRSGSSGMGRVSMSASGSSGGSGVRGVFGKSANEVAYKAISDMKYSGSPRGKYEAVESIANGNPNTVAKAILSPAEIMRTQAGPNNPDLFRSDGTWAPGYHAILTDRLGSSGTQQLNSALRSQAQRWLRENPMIENYRKKGYKWDGTKFVKK